jgi:hypothetical protein
VEARSRCWLLVAAVDLAPLLLFSFAFEPSLSSPSDELPVWLIDISFTHRAGNTPDCPLHAPRRKPFSHVPMTENVKTKKKKKKKELYITDF